MAGDPAKQDDISTLKVKDKLQLFSSTSLASTPSAPISGSPIPSPKRDQIQMKLQLFSSKIEEVGKLSLAEEVLLTRRNRGDTHIPLLHSSPRDAPHPLSPRDRVISPRSNSTSPYRASETASTSVSTLITESSEDTTPKTGTDPHLSLTLSPPADEPISPRLSSQVSMMVPDSMDSLPTSISSLIQESPRSSGDVLTPSPRSPAESPEDASPISTASVRSHRKSRSSGVRSKRKVLVESSLSNNPSPQDSPERTMDSSSPLDSDFKSGKKKKDSRRNRLKNFTSESAPNVQKKKRQKSPKNIHSIHTEQHPSPTSSHHDHFPSPILSSSEQPPLGPMPNVNLEPTLLPIPPRRDRPTSNLGPPPGLYSDTVSHASTVNHFSDDEMPEHPTHAHIKSIKGPVSPEVRKRVKSKFWFGSLGRTTIKDMVTHETDGIASSDLHSPSRPSTLSLNFGVPLTQLLQHSVHIPHTPIKLISRVHALHQEGKEITSLFEINLLDDPAKSPRLEALLGARAHYDHTDGQFIDTCEDVSTVGGLLMLWLMMLPDPVLCFDNTAKFLNIMEIERFDELRIATIRSLIFSLSKECFQLFEYILAFLCFLVEKTQFSASTLGNTFGYLLLDNVSYHSQADVHEFMGLSARLITYLIDNYHHIFMNRSPEIQFMKKDNIFIVKCASIEQIILKLIDIYYDEPEFPQLIAQFHPYFTTIQELFHRLVAYWSLGKQPYEVRLRARILSILRIFLSKHYLSSYPDLLPLHEDISSFVNANLASITSPAEQRLLNSLLEALAQADPRFFKVIDNHSEHLVEGLPTELLPADSRVKLTTTTWLASAKALLQSSPQSTLESVPNLHLSQQQIESLTESMKDNNHLRVLKLHQGFFRNADSSLRCLLIGFGSILQSLHLLDLSRNAISVLPEEWAHLVCIRELNLSHNSLSSLHTTQSIRNPLLTVLDVSFNKLKEVPDIVRHLPSLLRLDVRNNKITTLPQHLAALPNLRELLCANNPIKNVPKELLISSNDPEQIQLATLGLLTTLKPRPVHSEYVQIAPASSGSIPPKKPVESSFQFKLTATSPSYLAQQLCMFEHGLFSKIPLNEILHKNFHKRSKSPNWQAAVSQFNSWSLWVCAEVTRHTTSLSKRIEALSRFIRVAEVCLEYRNFNTSYALVAGMKLSPISRLKLTWAGLNRKIQVKWERLEELFSIEGNHKNYREALQTSTPPLIPYLGLYSKDLIQIEDPIPLLISSSKGSGGAGGPGAGSVLHAGSLINLAKLRLLWDIVRKISKFQETSYRFSYDQSIVHYLHELSPPSEEESFKRSLICEPRVGH